MNLVKTLGLAAAITVIGLAGTTAHARTDSYCTGATLAGNAELERLVEESKSLVQSYLQAYDTPGVVVAFTLPGAITCSLASGWADKELRIAMTPDHRLHAGSHPKTYTAALALALDHEGVISLDAPINRYVSGKDWFQRIPNGERVTVRQLMGMATGLEVAKWDDDVVSNARYTGQNTGIYNPGNLEQWWNSYLPIKDWNYIFDQIAEWAMPFAPGADVLYTDTQYIMLGLVLEAASGEKFEEAVQRRFHYPLQMTLTAPADRRVIQGIAKGYTDENTVRRGVKAWEDDAVVTDGVFDVIMGYPFTSGHYFSNPRDLTWWLWTYYSGRLFDFPYLDDIKKSFANSETPKDQADYGSGVVFETHPRLGEILSHNGGMPGYRTIAQYYSDHDFAIAAQFNKRDHYSATQKLSYDLADRVAAYISHDR